MIRPCFLVVDREFPGTISTRKLVIETAKFNVITAYSPSEALETLAVFPAINGVVLDAETSQVPCDELVAKLKMVKPNLKVVAISGPRGTICEGADYHLDSFDPRELLNLLKAMQPEEVKAIEKDEERLNRGER